MLSFQPFAHPRPSGRLARTAAAALVLAAIAGAASAQPVTLTWGGYTWIQENCPNVGSQLTSGVHGGAMFNTASSDVTGTIAQFPASVSGGVLTDTKGMLAVVCGIQASGGVTPKKVAVNLPYGADVFQNIHRRGLSVGWAAGTVGGAGAPLATPVLPNGPGADFVIFESGSAGAPEGMIVRARIANRVGGPVFTRWVYRTPVSQTTTTGGSVLFAYQYDLSDMGLTAVEQIDRIEIANIVHTDRIDAPGAWTGVGPPPAPNYQWHPAGGVHGGSLEFGAFGLGDFASWASPLFSVGQQGTLSFWVRMEDVGRRNEFFEGPSDSGLEFQYRTNSGGQYFGRGTVVGGDFVIQNGGAAADVNTWVNLQLTWDANANGPGGPGVMRIYRNGVEVGYVGANDPNLNGFTPATAPNTAGGLMVMGRDIGDPSRDFDGQMDDVAWFNAVLSPADRDNVRLHTNMPALLNHPNLVAYWPLDTAAGNVENDAKNGIPLTFTAGPLSWTAQGFVLPEQGGAHSATNPGPYPGAAPLATFTIPFGNATFDPDPLYLASLHNLVELQVVPVTNLDTGNVYADINSAMADPATLSGHTLQVSAGTHSFATTVSNGKWVTIQGVGSGGNPAVDTILSPAGPAFTLTTGGASAAQRLVLKDMRLAPGGDGIAITAGLSFLRLENIAFAAGGDGVDFNYVDPQVVSDVQITGCAFTCGGAGVRSSSQADAAAVTISGCDFNANGTAGILLGGGAASGSMTITNWQVQNSQFRNHNSVWSTGIWLKTTTPGTVAGFAVDGCTFEDNGNSALPYVNPFNPFNPSGMFVGARAGSSISGLTVSNSIFRDTAASPGQFKGLQLDNFGGAGSLATTLVSNTLFQGHQVGIAGTFNGETVCLTNVTFTGQLTADTLGVNLCAGSVTLSPDSTCYDVGDTVTVSINSISPQVPVVGGQFFLSFDATKLAFVDGLPGDAPFTVEVFQSAGPGMVDFAVGVPGGGPGTSASTTMARLQFQATAEICSAANLVTFRAHTPPTRLTNAIGDPVVPTTFDLTPISIDSTPPTITPPAPITVNADAGVCTAAITVPPLVAMDTCGIASIVNSFNNTADASGTYPLGTTTVTWTVTDTCGNVSTAPQSITVNASNTLSVTVELAGIDPGPLTRCITFDVTNNCSPTTHHEVSAPITFTNGVGSASVDVPCGNWTCITARDRLHTLRSTDSNNFAISGVVYTADFTGADALVGGNLNDDNVIDILDFGTLVGQFGQSVGAGTNCATPAPHADISGDGSVFSADFTFIQTHFLFFNEPDCCGSLLVAPIDRIPVEDLIAGRPALLGADLNHDGWLDAADMTSLAVVGGLPCRTDWNGDAAITPADVASFVGTWFGALSNGNPQGDFDGNGAAQPADLASFVNAWIAALAAGC